MKFDFIVALDAHANESCAWPISMHSNLTFDEVTKEYYVTADNYWLRLLEISNIDANINDSDIRDLKNPIFVSVMGRGTEAVNLVIGSAISEGANGSVLVSNSGCLTIDSETSRSDLEQFLESSAGRKPR